MQTDDRLLTPGEVAALFRVDPKTVTRWAAAGKIGSIRTPGGHRRFRESEVKARLQGELGGVAADDEPKRELSHEHILKFTPGEPFFNEEVGFRPGFVAGVCGHAVAQSERNAGLKNCERCGG